MSGTDRPSPERLATVSALAAKLAEKALAKRMLQRPVDDQTVTALAEAVLLLEEHGHPVPPLALDLLARFFQERRRQAPSGPEEGEPADRRDSDAQDVEEGTTVAGKVMGFFRALRPGTKS
ncbi:hypothetical protein [Methylobacterium soli]|uniref:Uncharacterized protein n=1 Tax=Methylobacterium soli TaxID=553447 RepID=A0A6L3SXF2_9HYPH|nr:hypothetical protein [Methylobacterium soli]KAB1078584.1 hypothetical protein F6X53_14410 [Methylobacterium soli]GJE44720.1 hypothetical protein AEGHOMDF_3910 [Methylobacterium soli]